MKSAPGTKEKALSLRVKGLSYDEILVHVPVSISTINLWCRNVPLSLKQRKRLKERITTGSVKARANWIEKRRVHKIHMLTSIENQTKGEVGLLTKRDRFIAGILLYEGEGDKTQERVGLANSNPAISLFAMNWMCEFLNIDRSAFKVHLYLHVGLNERRAREFWAKTLQISPQQITYVYRPKPRKSHKGNVHKFGVSSIRYHNKMAHRRIMGWVRAVLNSDN